MSDLEFNFPIENVPVVVKRPNKSRAPMYDTIKKALETMAPGQSIFVELRFAGKASLKKNVKPNLLQNEVIRMAVEKDEEGKPKGTRIGKVLLEPENSTTTHTS